MRSVALSILAGITAWRMSHAGAASAIATEQGFAFELAYGTLVPGWARAQQNRLEEGIAGMRLRRHRQRSDAKRGISTSLQSGLEA